MSNFASESNTLVFGLTVGIAFTVSSTSLLEIELSSANSALIKTGITATDTNRQIACGVIGLSKRTAGDLASSAVAPRCILVQSSTPKIRIENYEIPTVSSTFYVILYDLLNSVVAQDSVDSLNAVVVYTDVNSKARSRVPVRRAYTTISGSSPAASSQPLTTTVTGYYAPATLTKTITSWPASCSSNCRLVVRSSGSDWAFQAATTDFEFKIDSTAQTTIVDLANNAFVVLSTTNTFTSGGSVDLTFGPSTNTAFRNPLPSQANSNTFTMYFSTASQYKGIFTMSLPYGSLTPATISGSPSSVCTVIGSRSTGSNYGNVACYLRLPLTSLSPTVNVLRVDFPTTAQFSKVYPYCEAYVSTGPTTLTGGQLTCSRAETAAGTTATILVSGFTFSNSGTSYIRVYFRARLLQNALTANFYLQMRKSDNTLLTVNSYTGYSVSVGTVISNSYRAPTLFQTQNFVPTPLAFGAVSPLRIVTYVESAISSGDSIEVDLGSGFALSNSALPQCTMRSETSNYLIPVITRCVYTAASSLFTLYPISTIGVGRHLILIGSHQTDLASDGVTFPSDTVRISAKVSLYSPSSSVLPFAYDMIHLAMIASPFASISVKPQYNLVGSKSSQFELNIKPAATDSSADTATNELILVLEFPTSVYDVDLGASTATFAADGISYKNGMLMPSVFDSGFGTSAIATLHYGTSSEPARIIISKHSKLPGSLSTIRLGLVKNPGDDLPLRMNMYVLSYSSGQAYATVLYQASYTNYYFTVASAGETGTSSFLSFSAPYAQQATDITFQNKNFHTDVDTNSKVYVKLLNSATGFNYNAMSSITCTGYTVQWHKTGYIFYLVPSNNKGTTPSITCSGFVLGSDIETISIETGIHKAGNIIYASTDTKTMEVLNPIPSGSISVVRMPYTYGYVDNRQSINQYKFTFDTSVYKLKANGYLLFVIPSGLAVVNGLTEYIYVSSLTDNINASPPASIQAVITSGNIKISGYSEYSGSLTFTIFLRNIDISNTAISLWMYDEKSPANLVARADLASIVVDTATYAKTGSVTSFFTDKIDVFAGEKFRLGATLTLRNALSASTSSRIQVTLPTNWAVSPTTSAICKYRVSGSAFWLRSTCTISLPTISFPIITLEISTDIAAGSVVEVRWTTEDPDYTQTGVTRATDTTVRQIFNIQTITSSATVETVWIPFILYPVPTPAIFTTTRWYTRGSGDSSIIEIEFTSLVDLAAADWFQLDLPTNDDIGQVFTVHLGTASAEKRIITDCAENPTLDTISDSTNSLLGCYIQRGRYTSATSGFPAKIIVRNEKTIDTAPRTVQFYIAKITNPTGSIPGGFVINVMTKCRDDGLGCPIYRLRSHQKFNANSPKSPYNPDRLDTDARGTPDSSEPDLLDDSSLTELKFNLFNSVSSTECFVIKYDIANIVVTTPCVPKSGTGMCIHFPRIGWTFFQPSSTVAASSSSSISFEIDNGDYYDRSNPNNFIIEAWSSGGVNEIIKAFHPNYGVKIPALATFPTQTDFNNQYIVRNFDNILRISITGIWRTQRVRRIIVATPSNYLTLPQYCMAGVDLADIGNTNYVEFPCQVTGDRQITVVINFPERWSSAYAAKPVYVYFRGFLPVDYMTGTTASSNITSYCDLVQAYVLDENTNYNFYISPTPTPIIRDVNLNLKSFNDRIPRISDYVMFYGAIWPNTPYGTAGPITQLLFEVDDAYAYPSLANLICMTKVVFKIQVACTLKRVQGRTQIYVTPPPNYQHSPFLLTITNSQETQLFIAPDREGSFLFNVTYLDAQGRQVEKSDSYMAINGEFVTVFSAEPIRNDVSLKTLYDFQFTTASRVTPQGFYQDGQSVYTQIVLLFQTYSPAYPLDLGSDLPDGSEMSCIAVTGLTFNVKKKLTCQLIYGLPTDHSLVIITGYDAIPANTDIRIFIDDITTMPLAVTSRIKLEIRSTYTDTQETFVFYNSLVVSPQLPTASTAVTNTNLAVTRSAGASDVLRERTTYTVQFTLGNSVASGDFLIFDFPAYGYELESDYSNVVVYFSSASYPCLSWVMPKTNRVYIQPQATLPATSLTFYIVNIQNPSFQLSGSFDFALKAIIGKKLVDNYVKTVTLTSTVCTLFSHEQITYNSSYIMMNENTYQLSYTVDHAVPAAGSLAILFDPAHFNLRPSNPSCELVSGFSDLATCEFELFLEPLVRIRMNGQAMDAGTPVVVNIINVNNPTDNSAPSTITLKSYFDSAFGTTNTICSKPITLATFKTLAAIKCPITIKPEINNVDITTDYIITLECSGDIRNATVVDIHFPSAFKDSFGSDLSCSTNGNYMLQQCSLIARTTRVNILISKPDSQTPLEIRIRNVKNPISPTTYSSSVVNLVQYGVTYGAIDPTASSTDIVLIANDNFVKSDNKLTLSIFPKNFGEKATYFFNLPGITVKQVPDQLILDFDTSYSTILGTSLECGTFTPDSTFGKSYALNYETMINYKGFTCEVDDDYKLKFTLSPTFSIVANKPFTLFFYVQGVINPSINSKTSYSFNFLLLASGSAVFSSQNSIAIAFHQPPSLLQIKSFATSDTNILAPATYTFTLQATAALPASTSTSTKEYELELILPAALYPDFMQPVKVVYSFPDSATIQAGSSAFNYHNSIFFSALYPDLYTLGSFRLTLSNVSNPSVESTCGLNAAGDPVKFETQYVSRKQGFVYGKTYPIADQKNCLPLGKSRDAVKVISPLYLRKGLIYTITLQVEEAASNLYLTPVSTFLTFEPKTVSFINYQARTVNLDVVVPRNVPKGDYMIKWRKKETGLIVNYLELQDTHVVVVDETTSMSITPIPKVRVETIKFVWTGSVARDVLVSLDIKPAEELIVQIKSKITDTKLKGSADGITFTQFPISLTFSKGVSQKKFYISAQDGAKDNVMIYTLSGANALSYDSQIADTPFSIQTQQSSTGFEVLSIQQIAILENMASYLVSLSNVGTVYYMVVIESSIYPSQDEILSGTLPGIESQFYKTGNVVIQKIGSASVYSSYVNITGLRSQTKFQVYFVARSVFGEYSSVFNYTFQTLKVSEGAILLIPTQANVTSSALIDALSIIIPISKSRLIFSGADEFPAPSVNISNQALGSQLNAYQITIAPDPTDNTRNPLAIANELQSKAKQDELAALIPSFYQKAGIRVTPVKKILPRVMVTPTITKVGYYEVTVHAELIEVGKLYAIVTEKTDEGNVVPTSYQISKGLMANNVKLDDRYFKTVSTTKNGDGDIVFDELRDFTEYNVYVTAGNDVPYDPVDLLDNSNVVQLDVTTLKNPNIGSSAESLGLYDSYYKTSAIRVSGLFWGALLMLIALILYI